MRGAAHDARSAIADAFFLAIRGGDLDALARLTIEHPQLVSAPLGGRYGTRTPLHVATDWPGYFPNGPDVVRMLIAAGADPNAREPAERSEAPLHWAASSDDVDVAEALIDGGADIEMPDGSIGTPLDNAIGYGCWHVARLLVVRGVRVDKVWHAAALGMLDRLDELLSESAAYDYAEGTPLDAATGQGTRRDNVITWLRELGARSSATPDSD